MEIAGHKTIRGGNGIADGPVDISRAEEILQKLQAAGFAHESSPQSDTSRLSTASMTRADYAGMFGPTTGDLVRLGATDLWVRVEKDLTTYGEECKFGGGKTLREGMGQASNRPDAEVLDTVITNALIIDWSGIYKADIGIKHGHISGIGKAGNPDVMPNVSPNMIVGSGTDVIAGEHMIITAGGIDTHIHLICPQQAYESIASGITTYLAGGTGPSQGSNATTCTPGKQHMYQMLQAIENLPLNYGVTGKGNDSGPIALRESIEAGACGLKLHEDWGTHPSAIDTCLSVCDEYDIQCLIHTDTLNESGFVESTIAAFKDRTIHTYHTEGAGGGHAPDIIKVVELENVLPSSTSPTRPYTNNTLDEHLDMLMVCHHLSRNIPEDVAFAESRIRAETIAAEDVLHDLGAISMMSSDSQAMGRCGEVILRTWHTAHKNKVQRGLLPEDKETPEGEQEADNFRVKRYVSKYTINAALAQGMGHVIGSVEVGKFADLVFWKPAMFGVKPAMVVKGGMISWSMMVSAFVVFRFYWLLLFCCCVHAFVLKGRGCTPIRILPVPPGSQLPLCFHLPTIDINRANSTHPIQLSHPSLLPDLSHSPTTNRTIAGRPQRLNPNHRTNHDAPHVRRPSTPYQQHHLPVRGRCLRRHPQETRPQEEDRSSEGLQKCQEGRYEV